jgi:hypothetical protein
LVVRSSGGTDEELSGGSRETDRRMSPFIMEGISVEVCATTKLSCGPRELTSSGVTATKISSIERRGEEVGT